MSKVVTLALIGVGGTGIIMGGVYLSGAFSTLDASLPKTLEDFKQNGAKGCVDYLFPSLDVKQQGTGNISNTDKVDASTFTSEASKSGASCLTINWEKDSFSTNENNWKGNFRWLWSFAKGDKGFMMFISASPSATEKELTLSGIFYLLTKDAKTNWKIEKNKEINSGKKINKDQFESLFPKVGAALKTNEKYKPKNDYWGFVNGKDEMEKACKTGDGSACTGTPKTSSFRGLWIMDPVGDTGIEIKTWSENLDTILTQLYTSSEIDLSSLLSSSKGEWKTKTFVEVTPPAESPSTVTTPQPST